MNQASGGRHPVSAGLALVAAVAATCGSDPRRPTAASSPSPSPTILPGTGRCRVTLAQYCGGPCPDYATVVERLRRGCATGSIPNASAGHCPGVFYYTSDGGGFVTVVRYFDGNGTMIGGGTYTDFNQYCNGASFSLEGGEILTCPRPLELDQLCGR